METYGKFLLFQECHNVSYASDERYKVVSEVH
jgi:hypothetical protein